MYLKAHELKAWLFHYSIPIMETMLSPLYFQHCMKFFYSIYVLNQASVSPENINLAEDLLKDFVALFSDSYGEENMTANLHRLSHLAEIVRKFGPLFVTSCLPFENANGILKKLVKGTKFSQLQICSGVSMF